MNTEIATRQNGLSKANKPFAPSLTAKEQKIIRGSRSPHCSKLLKQGDAEVNFVLASALNRSPNIAGYEKGANADENVQAEIILGMVQVVERYHWLRVHELEFVLEEGLIGEYGEFYGLNGRTLNGWVKKYFENERAEALKKQIEFEEKLRDKAKEAEDAERKEFYTHRQRQRIIDTYRKLKEHYNPPVNWKHIPPDIDFANIWYEKLWRAGAIRMQYPLYIRYVIGMLDKVNKDLRSLNQHTKNMEELMVFCEEEQQYNRPDEGRENKLSDSAKRVYGKAKYEARGRVFRDKIAELLNARQDIEEVLNHVGL